MKVPLKVDVTQDQRKLIAAIIKSDNEIAQPFEVKDFMTTVLDSYMKLVSDYGLKDLDHVRKHDIGINFVCRKTD